MAIRNTNAKENEPVLENGKKKCKEDRPATKVVVRRLPPTMSEEQFKMQISPLPEIDYFYFVSADMSLAPNAFTRAYINFVDQSDLFIFTQKFDGYVFIDSKGGEFPAIVEFAPFQRIPKNRQHRKKDPKVGTIEADPIYMAFKEQLEADNMENRTAANASKQHFFETSLVPEKKELNNTPLLDFIKNKRAERQRIRDEKREEKRKKDLERRRAKEELRRTKKDDDPSVVKVLNNVGTNKERTKDKEMKPNFVKKKIDEVKQPFKEKYSNSELRMKESKSRIGKSYLEERQRLAERREEQRKKLAQNQSSCLVVDAQSAIHEEGTDKSEDKPLDEKSHTNNSDFVFENKGRDADVKKSERFSKREENRKNVYKYDKYEAKRERETDELKRTKRTPNNEKYFHSVRKEDDRSEDGGRKRYSETRRNHDLVQRDRYKEKDKNTKSYSQKKMFVAKLDQEKGKTFTEKNASYIEIVNKNISLESGVKDETDLSNLKASECNSTCSTTECEKLVFSKDIHVSEQAKQIKPDEYKDKLKLRRNSFDVDKNKLSLSSSKLLFKEKYTAKRRNSDGSNKQSQSGIDLFIDKNKIAATKYNEFSQEEFTTKKDMSLDMAGQLPEVESNCFKVIEKSELKVKDLKRKRRNSTGEQTILEIVSSRRNSLGSEEKGKLVNFKECNLNCENVTEEDKFKYESKTHQTRRDPRTERRIRNKDRPSIEIYRPGMGKFSKQRLEREKVLGSSTEVESPSSSPSPTPILKHKTHPSTAPATTPAPAH